MSQHTFEVASGERFEFGRNWRHFLARLTPAQIAEAERSLQEMLGCQSLAGKSFLDIGSGSGLFSLAARRLGARVHSFDYDPQSVACTNTLRARYLAGDGSQGGCQWTIAEGSALDASYLAGLGTFDVVYSWGVLHHTGAMWEALRLAATNVAPSGQLFIAIYNHQPFWTRLHTLQKRTYVAAPHWLRVPLAGVLIAGHAARGVAADLARLRNPLTRFRHGSRARGMSWWYDCLDWIGGYPFETATPEAIVDFYRERGFVLERSITCGRGSGCNQFVFRRMAENANQGEAPPGHPHG